MWFNTTWQSVVSQWEQKKSQWSALLRKSNTIVQKKTQNKYIGTLETKGWAYLANIVKGEPEEEDVREGLDNTEEAINDPVGQPLCVILFNIALDGFYTE